MNATTRPYPRRRRWPWFVAGVVGLPLTLLVFRQLQPQSVAEARLGHLRNLGYPTTVAELTAWLPAPADTNNLYYPVWAAAQALKSSRAGPIPMASDSKQVLRLSEPWSADLISRTGAYVTNNSEVFVQTGEILNPLRTVGLAPLPLSNGFSLLLPHLAQYKDLAQSFAAKAGLDAEEKRPNAALNDLRAQLAIARALDHEPLIISQLVRMAIEAIASTTTERVLNRLELGEAELALLQAEFTHRAGLKQMVDGLVGEYCIGHDTMANPNQMMGVVMAPTPVTTGNSSTFGLRLYSALGFMKQDRAAYTEMMVDMIDIGRMDPWEQFPLLQTWENRVAAMKWYQGRIFTRMLLPALAKATTKETRNIAHLKCVATGLAILRFRQRHAGQLPENLAALTPDLISSVPLDPFDGQPLRYLPRAGGFVVYSVGPNRKDDGGKPWTKGKTSEDFDVTFTLEGPATSPR